MNAIKFGCQTYPWKMSANRFRGQMPHIIKAIANAGYQGLEAEIDMLGEYFYKPAQLKELLFENNITLCSLVLHQPWEHEQETEEEHRFSLLAIDFLKHFPFAKLVVSHHAGDVERGTGKELLQRRRNLISCMNSVCNIAAEEGIVTCYHPNSSKNSLFRTAEDYEVLFDMLEGTDIGYAPDIGHIVNGGMDPLTILKKSRQKIRHVHFKDRTAQCKWAVMGEGNIDFDQIVSYLKATDYRGWIVVENESPRAQQNPDDAVKRDAEYVLKYKG
ncbi:sugar phosphate isomerase/epimerase [[Clostridium] cellulosi]